MFSHVSLNLHNCHENMTVTKCRTVLARHQEGEDIGRLRRQQLAGTDQQLQATEYSQAILIIIIYTNEADALRLHVDPVVLGLNPHRTTYLKLFSAPKSNKPANGFEETCWDIKAAGVTLITSMNKHRLVFNNGLVTLCTEIVSKNKISVVIILFIDLWQLEASWILFVVSAATKNGIVIKYTITLKSWFLEKQDQQEVQYASHTTENLCVCPPVIQAAELSFRSEQGLYKTRTCLEHSKCGQYCPQFILNISFRSEQGLYKTRTCLEHSKCGQYCPRFKLNISVSPGKQLESHTTTDLQNIINSQKTIYLQKTTFCAQKEIITSESISESTGGRTVRPNTCQSQNSFGRQIMIIKKSTTVMFVAFRSSLRDQAIDNSYSGCIYKRTKVGRFFNAPSPNQSLFCHRHTDTAWSSKDCAFYDCCCPTLNRTEGICQIVFLRHIRDLLHKNVTMKYKDSVPTTSLLNFEVFTNGERAKEKYYHIETYRIDSIMFKAFLTHFSNIRTTEYRIGFNLTSFASFTFFGMGETVLFHICVLELAGSENHHLKPAFTFSLCPLNGTREITLVQPQLSERRESYGTCRLLTNDYWRTKQRLRTKFASTGRKQTKCSWDHYDNQQILLGQDSWRRKHNHRVYSGRNVVNTVSTVKCLFRKLNKWGREMTRRKKIDDSDEVMVWLFFYLHPGTIEISGADYRDEWLGENACYGNGKYKVIIETILEDNIRDKRQLRNPGVHKYDKYVATNRETNEDNQWHKSVRQQEYTDGVLGRVINSGKYQEGTLQESVTFSNYVQDELRKTTCLGKFQKNYIKLETNHSQCTNENIVETTNRNNCNNEDGSPQRQRRGWRRVNSRLTRELLVTDGVQCEIVSNPTVLPVGNRAYTLNSTLQTDLQHSDIPRCSQTTSIAQHQQHLVMQAGQNRAWETSHQRSVFPETGHSGRTGTSHQQSVFPETGHSGRTGTSHQQSVFPETGHSGRTGTSHQRSVFPETGHSGRTGTSHQQSVFPETGHSGRTGTSHQQSVFPETGHNRSTGTSHQRSVFPETGHNRSAGTSHQRSVFPETGHNRSTGTSHQRSLFPETGHNRSTGTSHQRSLFPETGHNRSTGTSHQRSVFLDAGQSENSEPCQTSSLNQLSDVMINAGLTDKDIEDFLNSEADLESFILNSGFAMELFSDFPVGGGLLSSVFGDNTVMGSEGEQADVVLASGGTNSDQLVTAGTDYTPPPLYNNHLSFNNMSRNASESHSHPCKALTPGPGTGLSTRSQNSHASSDYCQALFPSTSTASREISGNLTNTGIHDHCVIQVHSQDTVSPQGYGLPRGSSQHSVCHPEPMLVEVLTNGDLDFQENQLDITDEATPIQMEVGADELGEIFSINVSIPVSSTTDQCHSQPEAAGAKRVQSIESPSVFKTPVNVQLQSSVRPRGQCPVFSRGINKRTTAVDRGDVGHSGSRRKRSRLESPATHPACSRIRLKRKRGRPRLRKVSYNLRCRLASGQGRPKRL